MKKTLLAAALIAGFAGAAQAETSVTLYGIIDTGIGYEHTTGTKGGVDVGGSQFGMINGVQSGSRWGLKGTEDLGNGLQAVFQLESGFDSSTGKSAQGGRLFGRQATVGLQSASWGRLDLGRQTNIASKYIGAFDPFGASFRNANAGTAFQSANTYRVDNMVLYQTPNFSGFQFGIGYSWNADGGISSSTPGTSQADHNNQVFTTGVRYTNGPIDAALTYDLLKVGSLKSGTGDSVNVNEWNIGGSYDFEVVKAYLAFGQMRNGVFGSGYYNLNAGTSLPVAMQGFKANSYLVGLSAPIGNGNLMFSWQMSDPNGSSDEVKTAQGTTSKMNIFGLGYTYNLSKRTNLYAFGSYTKHAMYQDDLKTTDIGVGIRHQF